MSLAIGSSIERTLNEVFLHRGTWAIGILVEEQQALGQLTIVQTLGLQHIGSHSLVVTLGHEGLDALAVVLLTGSIECIEEGKLIDRVEILLLEIGGGHIIVGIDESEHVLEHAAGGTRCRHELHNLIACGLVLVPYLLELLALIGIRSNDALTDSGGCLQLQEGETCLKLV